MDPNRDKTPDIFVSPSNVDTGSSLDLPATPVMEERPLDPVSSSPYSQPEIQAPPKPQYTSSGFRLRFTKEAIIYTFGAGVIIAIITILAIFLGTGVKKDSVGGGKNSSFGVSTLNVDQVKQDDASLSLESASQLAVNGELQVNKGLVIAPGDQPNKPKTGQIYYDQKTNQPYFYNGQVFIPFAQPAAGATDRAQQTQQTAVLAGVSSLGGLIGGIDLGTGLTVVGNTLRISGDIAQAGAVAAQALNTPKVTSLQGLTGALTLTSGNGIAISGTTITNTGVLGVIAGSGIDITDNGDGTYTVTNVVAGGGSMVETVGGLDGDITLGVGLGTSGNSLTNTGVVTLTGTTNQISVSSASGNVTLSLPQNIAATSSPAFSSLNLTNNLTATGYVSSGNNSTQGSLRLYDGTGRMATLQPAILGQNTVFTIPDPGQANATLCLTTGNCSASGSAGGDLTGTYPNPTIGSLQGTTLNISGLTAGQILQYNGTAFVNQTITGEATLDNSGYLTIANNAITNSKLANNSVTSSKIGDGEVSNAKLANSTINVNPGAGLTGGGLTALGGTATLAVAYGSATNTAVQGNTTLVCPGGTGNLSGGGNTITLGAGGTCSDLTVVNNPTFSGLVTAEAGLSVGVSGSVNGVISLANSTNSNVVRIEASAPVGIGDATFVLPVVAGGSVHTICTAESGNCLGSGGITGSGTAGVFAIFGVGGNNILDSNLSESAGTLTYNGDIYATGNTNTDGTTTTDDLIVTGSVTLGSLAVGIVQSDINGNLTSSTVDRNSATLLTGTLNVANGGTGATSFTANGILFGNGTGALQATNTANDSILVTDNAGSPSLAQALPDAVQANITRTGALSQGSITTGFGTIQTGNNISTTATLQGGTLNATTAIQLNGTNINTAGTLTNVAYLNQANVFTAANTFTNSANVQGGLTLGVASSIAGILDIANSTNANITRLQAAAPSGTGTATFTLPSIAGGSTDEICTVNSGNCAGSGGGITGSGTQGVFALFGAGGNNIVDSNLSENAGTLTYSGNQNITGTLTVDSLGAGIVQSDANGELSSSAVDRNSATLLTGTLNVANGGTGAITLTSNGILFGAGTGAIQATNSGADSILATDNLGNPSLSQYLPNAVQGNITTTGALSAGSITGSFGVISTANNITTSATLQGGTVNATTAIQLNGTNINTAGTLTNVAYLNQANVFTAANTFSSTANIQGSLTLGLASTTDGNLIFANSVNNNLASILVATPSGTGNVTYTLPSLAGGSSADICLTTGNCAGSGGGIVGSGTNGTVAVFNGTGSITDSNLVDTGTTLEYSGDEVCTVTAGNCAGSGGGLVGTGTTNYIAKFTGAGTVADSNLQDDGTTLSYAGALTVTGNTAIGTTPTTDTKLLVSSYYPTATGTEQKGLAVETNFGAGDPAGLKQGLRVYTMTSHPTGTLNDLTGQVSINAMTGGGNVTNSSNLWIGNDISSGTVANSMGINIQNSWGSGTLQNQYGLYIHDLTKGTNSNYAIYTEGSTPSYFGGNITSNAVIQGTRFTSTVTTGTAPLTVASTTLVTNLNADMLDGLHASSFAPSTGGNYIAKNTNDTSTANYLGTLLGLTNSNTGAAGVLSLTNAGTNSALDVTSSANPSGTNALIHANNTSGSPGGNLLRLAVGGVGRFSVDYQGTVIATNSYVSDSGTAGVFRSQHQSTASTNTSAVTVASGAASGATSNTGAVFVSSGNSTTSGNTGNIGITTGNATSGNSGSVVIDSGTASGTTGVINVGTTNASAVNISRTGVATTINGTLTVTQATTLNGGLTAVGSTSINATGSSNTTIGNNTGTLTVVGSNSSTFTLNGVVIDATEFNRLDGKNAALVDTNDAVNTAITGTGALANGSITSGFGAISTTNNISTTAAIQGSTLISTVTTGTAPLTVASTTLVTNLNADMLDGQHASYFAPATGANYIAKNAADSSTINAAGYLLTLVNNNSGAASVLSLQSAGTNSALSITQSSNPTSGQALIYANNTAGSPSGNLINLQANGSSRFLVDAGGVLRAYGAIVSDNGSTGTFKTADTVAVATDSAAVSFASGNASGAGSTSGNAFFGSGNGSSGYSGVVTVASGSGGNTGGLSLRTGNAGMGSISGSIAMDVGTASGGTTGSISIGTSNASAVSISRTGVATTVNGSLTVTQAATFNSNLTVSNGGYLSTQRGTDYSTNGTSNNVNFGNASLYRLTGSSAQTITGIAGGVDGRQLTLINANTGSFTATISNESASSSAANRIVTGTGADVALASGAAMTLVYDSGASRWRITSGGAFNAGDVTPMVEVYKTTPVAGIAHGTSASPTFDSENVDNGNMHSTVTNAERLTATTPGYYHVYGKVNWTAGNTSGTRQIGIAKNGVTGSGNNGQALATAADIMAQDVSWIVYLNGAGDYVTLNVFQTSGSTLSLTSGAVFGMYKVDGPGGPGINAIGVLDSNCGGSASSNGATISGGTICLQSATTGVPGLVNTGAQTFGGLKTFNNGLTVQGGALTASAGATLTGGTVNINNSGSAATNIGVGSTGAITIGNSSSGAIDIRSANDVSLRSGTSGGAVNINASNNATTNINTGTSTGGINLGNSNAGNINLTSSTAVNVNSKLVAGSDIVANGSATGTTATTTGTGTNTTTLTFTSTTSFANGDVLFIDNAGQDYYTRIVSGGNAASVTVSPAITFEASRTVTKYNIQNIGALVQGNDYSTQSNRFFQGYFLGGVVTGSGSTTLSDGSLQSTVSMNFISPGYTFRNTGNSSTAFRIQDASGSTVFRVATDSNTVLANNFSTTTLSVAGAATFSGNVSVSGSVGAGYLSLTATGEGGELALAAHPGYGVPYVIDVYQTRLRVIASGIERFSVDNSGNVLAQGYVTGNTGIYWGGVGGWSSGAVSFAGDNSLMFYSSIGSAFRIGQSGELAFKNINNNAGSAQAVCRFSYGGMQTFTVCAGTPHADYAEMYPVSTGVNYADIVSIGSQMVDTYEKNGKQNGEWGGVIGQVTQLVKSSQPHQQNTIGIVSDNYGDFSSTGYNIKESDNPMPVALNGRVPVKITPGSDPIQPGDYITTSTDPGKGAKATSAGFVIGKALSAWSPGDETVMVYVEQGYWNGPTPVSYIQNGGDAALNNLALSGNLTVEGNISTNGSISIAGGLTVVGLTKVADIEVAGHIITSGDAPVAEVQAAAGTAATCEVMSGNDTAGKIVINTGATSFNEGAQCELTFNKQFAKNPNVIISPTNKKGALLGTFVESDSTKMIINFADIPAASTSYTFNYFVIE